MIARRDPWGFRFVGRSHGEVQMVTKAERKRQAKSVRAAQREEERKRRERNERRQKFAHHGAVVFDALCGTMFSTLLMPFLPESLRSDKLRLVLIVVLGPLGLAALAYIVTRRWLKWTAAGLIPIVVIGGVLWYRSGDWSRTVNDYVTTMCDDPMWTMERPRCSHESTAYIVDHKAAFDPNGWHSWSELEGAATEDIGDMTLKSAELIGTPVRSIGRVAVTQPMGTSYVMQLRRITHTQAQDVADNDDILELFGKDEQPILTASAVDDSADSSVIAYCNFTPRPFFVPQTGDLVAFNGVPVAFGGVGLTHDGISDGQSSEIVYVMCSSVEELPLAKDLGA